MVDGALATIDLGNGLHTIKFFVADLAGNRSPQQTVVAGRDRLAPLGWFERQDTEHPQRVTAHVEDQDSGLTFARVEYRPINGGQWRSLGDPLESAMPLHGQQSLTAEFPDDGTLAPGTYELRIVANDAVQNTLVGGLRDDYSPASVNSPIRKIPNLTALVSHTALAKCTGRGRERRCRKATRSSQLGGSVTVAYGDTAKVSGQLTDSLGLPLVGAVLELITRSAGGAAHVVGSTTTGPDGRFNATLASGPNRTVRVRYAGSARYRGAFADMTVNVETGITLSVPRSVRSGATLLFRGRVMTSGAALPRGGKTVEIRYRVGNLWSKFVIPTKTFADGRFEVGYPFSASKRSLRFEFRASAPPQDGWPFATGVSKPVKVLVREAP
ncbi:MAG: carboxypeptidase regulatory-like domain-containing protein [Thermoleophilaceae bacterium]|nr:carboxypeptidase regulatory-like domain-containing protein [Thermoleophilaceae bacterium]